MKRREFLKTLAAAAVVLWLWRPFRPRRCDAADVLGRCEHWSGHDGYHVAHYGAVGVVYFTDESLGLADNRTPIRRRPHGSKDGR